MAAYQQVIDTFPETPWAQIARQRQSILRDKTGETL
jgi:outer membrane protein assembly factor BamD (BamD/ComL family)